MNEIFQKINENYFSLIWAHNLRALNGILALETWIRYWVARLEIEFSLLFCLKKTFQRVLYDRKW